MTDRERCREMNKKIEKRGEGLETQINEMEVIKCALEGCIYLTLPVR